MRQPCLRLARIARAAQACFRGYLARKAYRRLRVRGSSTLLSAHTPTRAELQRADSRRVCAPQAATQKIQAHARGWYTRKKVRPLRPFPAS